MASEPNSMPRHSSICRSVGYIWSRKRATIAVFAAQKNIRNMFQNKTEKARNTGGLLVAIPVRCPGLGYLERGGGDCNMGCPRRRLEMLNALVNALQGLGQLGHNGQKGVGDRRRRRRTCGWRCGGPRGPHASDLKKSQL